MVLVMMVFLWRLEARERERESRVLKNRCAIKK